MNIIQIRQAAETFVGTQLGPTYKALPYQFDISMNDARALEAGYCVLWGTGAEIDNIDQAVNIEQDLKLMITSRVFVRDDDEKIITSGDVIYASLDAIINGFVMDRLGRRDIIQHVRLTQLGEPQPMGQGRDIISLSCTFRVRYLIS
jgi:hypothetical protein